MIIVSMIYDRSNYFFSKRPKIFGGKYGLRGSSIGLDIHSKSYLAPPLNNITSSSTDADDDSSSAGFSTSRYNYKLALN